MRIHARCSVAFGVVASLAAAASAATLEVGKGKKYSTIAAAVAAADADDKIVVFKFKRRKNYSKKQGHRQGYTEVRIRDITLG